MESISKVVLPSSGPCLTLPLRKYQKTLCREVEGDSEVEVLAGLVSGGMFGGLVGLGSDGLLVGLVVLGIN